ncbi:Zinc finger and BTB domain-containing protein 7C [Apaloderma vittatum]|uniref:Zinc finger and BTB domain-containing protein 7C n=1 Tax=Apaloderma vittatum TaxID=57397 RepID=A0A091NRT7_APAVI|nr:Zinc finger and BTB domain-containing protein 7C [Apaloderma vittatum]
MANGIEDLIGIPFPNHSSEVLCGLNEQRHDGLLCDVILIVQDQEYRTHRSVLAACSKYFKKLFTTGTLTDQPYVYEIDFVKPEALSAILEFAYTSTLTITTSNVKHILSAAKMLEIQCIINVCLEIMEPDREAEEEDDKEDEDDDEDEDEDEEEEEEEEEVEDFVNQENLTNVQEVSCHQSPSKSDLTEEAYTEAPKDFPNHYPANNSSGHLGVIRDFSIESLLRENLYPKANIPERRPPLSPFTPSFFPHLWNGDFSSSFSQLEEPQDNGPLDLVIKKRKIKEEEEKEDLPPPPFPNDFFKDMFTNTPAATLGHIKAEADYSAYLNFLSATQFGGVFPPWPLEEERKIKPKASQQCPICNKVIMGAGKLPRHMRTHTGEKPYMCNICEVRFTRKSDPARLNITYIGLNYIIGGAGSSAFYYHFAFGITSPCVRLLGVKSFTSLCRPPRTDFSPFGGQTCPCSNLGKFQSVPGLGVETERCCFFFPISLKISSEIPCRAMCLPGPSPKHFLSGAKTSFSLQELESQFEETQMKLFRRAQLDMERNAGIFAFALGHNEILAAQPFFPLPDPWSTGFSGLAGLGHVAPISEAGN